MLKYKWVYGIFCAIIAYLAASFYYVNIDISAWSRHGRLVTIAFWLALWIVPLMLDYLNSDTKNKN